MDFQVVSDLHIDVNRAVPVIHPSARVLVMAGDIYPVAEPDYKGVLERLAQAYEAVLYVPGNHEYYGGKMGTRSLDAKMEQICYEIGNVLFMNKRVVYINDIAFCGATLWTDVNVPALSDSSKAMNDFSEIEQFSPRVERKLHQEHKDFLRSAVKDAKRRAGIRGAVLITHHAPDMRLAHSVKNRPDSLFPYYFSSDMQQLTTDPFVKVWVHGHTHESYVTKNGPPFFVTNAHGYTGEITGFSHCGSVIKI